MHLVRFSVLMCVAACLGCGDECRGQCGPPRDEQCSEKPFGSFGDLASGRAEYQQRCEKGAIWVFEAACKQGTIVLRSGTGYTSEGRFYDPKSGKFLGLTATTDVSSSPCDGKSHWPEVVPCESPTVTRVLCGDAFMLGGPGGPGITQDD